MPKGRPRIPSAPGSGTVSRLAVDPRRPERTVLYLDGKRAGDLATAVAEDAGLRVGDLLSEEVLLHLRRQDEPHRARSRALALLAVRDRSTREVEGRLRQAGFEATTIDDVVAWLRSLGYLDDARFAEHFASEKARSGWGERRIQTELRRKGVDRATVEDALETLTDDEDLMRARTDGLVDTARRRFGRQWRSDRVSAERRLAGFLLRRGYDWDMVSSVAGRLDAEVDPELGDAER